MKKLLNPSTSDTMIISILLIVSGLLLCLFNVDIILMATRVLGAAFALVGIYFLYYYFKKRVSSSPTPFFVGIPSTIIGVFMIASPESVIAILPMLIGIVCIINAILSMQKAFMLKDMKVASWKINLGFDVLLLLVGVILFLKPIQALAYILKITGAILIVQAIFMMLTDHALKKYRVIKESQLID